jgi:hypothetical protein
VEAEPDSSHDLGRAVREHSRDQGVVVDGHHLYGPCAQLGGQRSEIMRSDRLRPGDVVLLRFMAVLDKHSGSGRSAVVADDVGDPARGG